MKKKNFLKSNQQLYAVSISVIIGLLMSVILLLVSSFILTKYDFLPEARGYFWFVIALLSGFFSGLFAGRLSKSKGIIWGAVSGCIISVFTVMILIISVQFNMDVKLFILFPIYIISASIGAVISSNLK